MEGFHMQKCIHKGNKRNGKEILLCQDFINGERTHLKCHRRQGNLCLCEWHEVWKDVRCSKYISLMISLLTS